MSHEEHTHDSHAAPKKAPLSAAFWFTLLLTCLFIAAVNFVNVMGGAHEGAEHAETHESMGAKEASHEEATAPKEEAPAAAATVADTASHKAE